MVSTVAYNTPLQTAIDLVLMALGLVVLVLVVRKTHLAARMERSVRRTLVKRLMPHPVPHEELLLYQKGFAITRIEVPLGSRLAGRTLRDAALPQRRIQVLTIEREGEVIPIPHADDVIEVGNHLVLYGEPDNVQAAFGTEPIAALG